MERVLCGVLSLEKNDYRYVSPLTKQHAWGCLVFYEFSTGNTLPSYLVKDTYLAHYEKNAVNRVESEKSEKKIDLRISQNEEQKEVVNGRETELKALANIEDGKNIRDNNRANAPQELRPSEYF